MSEGYRFHHAWTKAAPRQRVYDVLVAVAGYPLWCPQVLAVRGCRQGIERRLAG